MASPDAHQASRVLKETFVLATEEIREMVGSVRLVFLVVVYLMITGSIGSCAVWIDEQTNGQLAAGASAMSEEERTMVVKTFVEKGASEHLAEALVNGDLPPMVLFVLFLSTFAIPGLMMLVGFNRISEDVTRRYTRYVLQRIHRGSYLAGKLLAHWLVSTVAVIGVQALLLAFAVSQSYFEADATIAAMPRIWAAMAILILAYSALTMFASSALNPPFLVLLLGIMGLFGVWVATKALALIKPELALVWMGEWDVALYALDPWAVLVFFAYTLVFILGAHVVLRRRDL